MALGESFHPGGLELTTRLANLVNVNEDSRILDAGSGRGASPVHLAKNFGCLVTGMTLETSGVGAGLSAAKASGVDRLANFTQGDIIVDDLGMEMYNLVLMECVLSILSDKATALQRLRDALVPNGRVAVLDVTFEGTLPPELQGTLAQACCLADAHSLEGYGNLLNMAGFTLEHTEDAKLAIEAFLKMLERKLAMAKLAVTFATLPITPTVFNKARDLFKVVQQCVTDGALGYSILVGRRN